MLATPCALLQLQEKAALQHTENLQLKREMALERLQNAEIERQDKERRVRGQGWAGNAGHPTGTRIPGYLCAQGGAHAEHCLMLV